MEIINNITRITILLVVSLLSLVAGQTDAIQTQSINTSTVEFRNSNKYLHKGTLANSDIHFPFIQDYWPNDKYKQTPLDYTSIYPLLFDFQTPVQPHVGLDGVNTPVSQTNLLNTFIDWVLDIQLITTDGEYRDLSNHIGVMTNTLDGRDGLDADFFVPNASAFGAMYFIHENWTPAAKLDYDYRSNEWVQQLWEFQIWDNGVSGDWNLRWPNITNVPGNIQLSLTNQDMSVILIPNLRLERESPIISLTSGSLQNYVLKAVVVEDTVAPYVQAGFVQNPLLVSYVDLYVFPSEPLEYINISVNDYIYVPQFNEGNFNIYRTSFEIEDYGTHTIVFSSGDLAGNNSKDTLLITFQGALAGRVVAPDGKVELNGFPNRFMDNRKLVGLGYGLEQSAHLLPADIVGNIYTTCLPPLQSSENVEIIFYLLSFGLHQNQFSKVSLYQETANGWKAIPAILNSQIGTLSAAINQSSRLALLRISGNTEIAPLLPETTELLASYPNPFNASTVILYTIANKSQVKIVIYDLLGREVVVLRNEFQTSGRYTIIWRGKNQFGFNSPSGIYFVRFEAGMVKHTKKLSFVR